MTEQTPTDAEIDVMVAAYLGECGPQATRVYSYTRAVLAKWGTPPAVARTETIELRRMLCAAHAGHLAYMDDGEAQDNREFPLIDFLRDSPPEIQDKLHRRALKKFSTPQPTQAQAGAVPLTDEQIKDEASHHGFIGSTEMLVKFVRGIEAAHGIKEGGWYEHT